MLLNSELRVFIDPPRSGTENMSIDETLLMDAVGGAASLRLYQWSAPTISLGHFQVRDDLSIPARFESLDRVRRLSGGGAILHDQELTYSCALPSSHPITREPGRLYDEVHAAIIEVLQEQGVSLRLRGADAFEDKSFLCYSRGDARDLVLGPHKIVGSAQRRRQGAVLQHGSILLAQSPHAPEFPGIFELTDVRLDVEVLRPRLVEAITRRLELAR